MRASLSPALFALWLVSLSCGRAWAHDPGLSSLTVAPAAEGITFRLVVRNHDLPPGRRGDRATCLGTGVLRQGVAGAERTVDATCRALDGEHTVFEGAVAGQGGAPLTLSIALLRELARGHRTFVRVLDEAGRVRETRMLARDHAPLSVHARPAHPRASR